ncbi:CRISPR-associated helicase/endonuclease Cas3 [Paenisporosarcina sp. TG20]|uniref:CRISPR-associated helicase/endonuclease Cas3 n=1 Tax=Paenisporosarcina sp. TG20 TaxID=1211706 RepID=UPI00031E60E4|nr:CRISPR-associated helicase/endonuclease Cas3 [Paenisporosarcina sp. TG20]
MQYIAHIREKDGEIQTVQQHLESVQQLCEKYGEKIGVKHLAGLSGLLHDLGKNTGDFKEYIQEAVANPDNPPRKGSVDHSTAGGKLLFDQFHDGQNNFTEKIAVEWMAMCIISHHQGLRDFLSPDMSSGFLKRVEEKELDHYGSAVSAFFETQVSVEEFKDYFEEAKSEAEKMLISMKEKKLQPITTSFLIKYIFSCLIDADRTNTRMFEENELVEQQFDRNAFFSESYVALMKRITSYNHAEDANHPINLLRKEMSNQCEDFASNPSGIYTLSIPTGGGKTLASLRYALKHAMKFEKERIIYIVPYTTIIEQNAQEVRDILNNDQYILEHHSNVMKEKETTDELYNLNAKKLNLAKDNWDSPIIFTTMVQFLNVFYSRGTRNVRRLHNLANSILIFDEVQSVPIKCTSLFNESLNFLSDYCNSSIVLCTATQPALDFVENKLKIFTDAEMIRDLKNVSESFKRVDVIDKTTPQGLNATELKEFIEIEMQEVKSILIILNTKTAVRKLFEELNSKSDFQDNDYKLFHLSTNMCPAHRKEVLKDVKNELLTGKKVICLSTQLIEAGVDISFECVIRSLAGLDSIAQAAGRCNRHGKDKIRNVYIIKSADEVLTNLKEIKIGAEQTKRILDEFKRDADKFGSDLLSQKAMSIYFQYYYHQIEGELKYTILELQKDLVDLLNQNKDYYAAFKNKNGIKPPIVCRQSFATAEKYFNVIDSPTTSVLAPYNEEAKEIILALNGDMNIKELSGLLKKAQQFTINVFEHELKRLEKEGDVFFLLNGNILTLRDTAYTKEMGLDSKGEGSWTPAFA